MGNRSSLTCAVVAVLLAVASPMAYAGGYTFGFVWDVQADWVVRVSSDHGTTNGNPSADAMGNPVWGFDYVTNVPAGSGLGSANPWYEGKTIAAMKWDSDFWSSGGRWANIDDGTPNIAGGWMNHLLNNTEYGDYSSVPLLRWTNPCPDPIKVSLKSKEGPLDFAVGWRGNVQAGGATSVDADIAVVLYDVSEASYQELYAVTVSKPTNNNLDENLTLSPLWIEELPLDTGDQILITARGTSQTFPAAGAQYITFYDGMEITVVPEPATLSLLALGGLAMLRRRRR